MGITTATLILIRKLIVRVIRALRITCIKRRINIRIRVIITLILNIL